MFPQFFTFLGVDGTIWNKSSFQIKGEGTRRRKVRKNLGSTQICKAPRSMGDSSAFYEKSPVEIMRSCEDVGGLFRRRRCF